MRDYKDLLDILDAAGVGDDDRQVFRDAAVAIRELLEENGRLVKLRCWKCGSVLAIPICRPCAEKTFAAEAAKETGK